MKRCTDPLNPPLGTVASYHLNNGTLILLDAAYNKVLEYRHQ